VVEEKLDGWREIEEIESSGGREKEGEGVYPPVGEKVVRKRLKGKRIGGFPLSHDVNDGREMR
jgi:hypothetical protein